VIEATGTMPSNAVIKKNDLKPASGWSKISAKTKEDIAEDKRKIREDREKRLAAKSKPKKVQSLRAQSEHMQKLRPSASFPRKSQSLRVKEDTTTSLASSKKTAVPRALKKDPTSRRKLSGARNEHTKDAIISEHEVPLQSSSPEPECEKSPPQKTKSDEAMEEMAARLKGKIRDEEREMRKREREREHLKKAVEDYKNALKNPPVVPTNDGAKKVLKISALLARGGPEVKAYRQEQAEEAVNSWILHPDKCSIVEHTFDGSTVADTKKEMTVKTTIRRALERFKHDPEKYLAMIFPYEGDENKQHDITLILRAGTTGFRPTEPRNDNGGSFKILTHFYQRLEPFPKHHLPRNWRDQYTDDFTFQGKKLHSRENRAILPGRGMGVGDCANMKFIGDYAEPNDVVRGTEVGNCWLLSAIACVTDYDFAVRRLFRKTPNFPDCPVDLPNQYVVTLWDLKTWKEVDVMVDERLPVRSGAPGFLLGAKPSKTGNIWVPYLEKAIAAHCGGWDKLQGGACTSAWPMMTGSRNQYTISQNPKTKNYFCSARFNKVEQQWTEHTSSPHDSDQSVWKVSWPKVGGGGSANTELSEENLFQKLVAWNDNNFLIGAGTNVSSDEDTRDGIIGEWRD
jgi:hypothetical protein